MSDLAIFLVGLGVTMLVGVYVALVFASMRADPREEPLGDYLDPS